MRFPETVKQHRANVARLNCVITDRPHPSFHHAQGGSVAARLREMGLEGHPSRKDREALIIPLAPEYHYIGPEAIDGQIGRTSWEEKYGEQAKHLDDVSELLGYNVWELHRLWTAGLKKRATIRRSGSAGPQASSS